jgi:hypothetical protein
MEEKWGFTLFFQFDVLFEDGFASCEMIMYVVINLVVVVVY